MARTPSSGLGRTLATAFPFILAGLIGVLVGLAFFTFGYAGGAGYFGHESETCNQCHAMNKQFNAWEKGSHKNVATCQDCHAPHDDVVAWAINEADNGFWHSLKFTTGQYPENIRIREVNRVVVEASCRKCHAALTDGIEFAKPHNQQVSCVQCHSNVGHMR